MIKMRGSLNKKIVKMNRLFRLKMEYCCCIWPGAVQFSPHSPDKIQNWEVLWWRLLRELFSHSIAISPQMHHCYYHHCHDKGSDELHSLILQVQTFTGVTCHTMSTELNHLYFLCIPFVSSKFHWAAMKDKGVWMKNKKQKN